VKSYVYLITNNVNGKRYVGSTKFPIEERWAGHCYDAQRQGSTMQLHCAIRKHGIEQFKIELLEECETREIAYDRETVLIGELGTHVSLGVGYNVLRNGRFGATRGMTGKKHTDETRRRMSEVALGRHHTLEACNKMSKTRIGQRCPWKWVSVQQLNDANEIIATYPSMKDASVAVGGGHSHIWACCAGKRKHAKGFKWRYATRD